jgi:prepilin-type N-terminal cleavage/methylation domain-containing protein
MTISAPKARGFSLLEMSVVLVIIGVVVAGGVAIIPKVLEKRQFDDTQARLKIVQQALLDYRKAYNRLPCPGDSTLAMSSANFGIEAATAGACTGTPAAVTNNNGVSFGMLPVRTLQLPDDMALDGWGRRIGYNVDTRYTNTNAFTSYTTTSGGGTIYVYDGISTAPSTVTYVSRDIKTKGNWIDTNGAKTYGNLAYYIPKGAAQYPGSLIASSTVTGLSVSVTGTNYAWDTIDGTIASSGNYLLNGDLIYPEFPYNKHIISSWYNASPLVFTVTNTLQVPINMTLYSLDVNTGGNSAYQTVAVGSYTPTTLVGVGSAAGGFFPGYYDTWRIIGSQTVTVTKGGATAVAMVHGIFFDVAAMDGGVYVLVSAGPNGHGAYPRNGGSAIYTATTNTSEIENAHINATGAAYTTNFGKFNMMAPTVSSTSATNVFDDIVVKATRQDLKTVNE